MTVLLRLSNWPGSWRFLWLCPALAWASCSAVVDFDRGRIPGPDGGELDGGRPDGSVEGGGVDAEAGMDATGPDAGADAEAGVDVDAGDASVDGEAGTDAGDADVDGGDADAGPACDLATHAGCGLDELCCMGSDGPECQATDPTVQCTGCETPCDSDVSSACSERTCLCGSEPACEGPEPRCDASMGACVECIGDGDCPAGMGADYCVDNVCSACDPGALSDASDDEGCDGTTPICGAGNVCTGCSVDPDDCPGSLYCVIDEGCFGCDPEASIGSNGCPASSPVCGMSGADYTCMPCLDDGQCDGAYCDGESGGGGGCYALCDPDDHRGCDARQSPFCLLASGAVSCVACTDPQAPTCSEATGGPFCKESSGTLQGACVDCRGDGDCGELGQPICDDATFECRACAASSEASDCPGARCDPVSGECVSCLANTDCSLSGQGICDPVELSCRGCAPATEASDCPGGRCDVVSGECVPCLTNADCTTDGARICDPEDLQCRACSAATEASDCPGSRCNESSGNCVECLVDGDCGSKQICGTDNACVDVQCTQDAHCSGTKPHCNLGTNVCERCDAAGVGGDDFCDGLAAGSVCATEGPNAGACGGCDPSDHAECDTATLPVCDPASLTCVPCGDVVDGDAACETKLTNTRCNGAGRCVCDTGWVGPGCDSCATGFMGPGCDECADGYEGPTCDQCAAGYYGNGGATCTACSCAEGEICDDGTDGTGACCGDGTPQSPEVCDDGQATCGPCNATCTATQTGEACAGEPCTANADCASGSCDLTDDASMGTCQ